MRPLLHVRPKHITGQDLVLVLQNPRGGPVDGEGGQFDIREHREEGPGELHVQGHRRRQRAHPKLQAGGHQ